MSGAPPVDARNAAQLREQVITDLRRNVPEWTESAQDQASAALIGIFTRFCEIVVQRLNRVPEKNFLAFLDLLGVAREPPQPARVPLTFTLAAGRLQEAVVPAATQVAAPPADGEKNPVIFETERSLIVVPVALRALIAADAERDLLGDHSTLLVAPPLTGSAVFSGDGANEHVLYVGDLARLGYAALESVTLQFELQVSDAAAAPDARVLQWQVWNGSAWQICTVQDATNALRVDGNVTLTNLPPLAALPIHAVTSRWLRCQLLTPVAPGSRPAQNMVRAGQLPLIQQLTLAVEVASLHLLPQAVFTNSQAVDITKPFAPFGDKPKLGDAFYLASEAFAQPGTEVDIDITGSLVPTQPSDDLLLKWEVWTVNGWTLLGTSTSNSPGAAPFREDTRAFTSSNTVTLVLPAGMTPTTINGVSSHWLRVQIAAGNYGVDARYVSDGSSTGGFHLVPASFAAPVLGALTLRYHLVTPPAAPQALLAYNNREFASLAMPSKQQPIAPFRSLEPLPPTLYAALAASRPGLPFPNRTITLYHGLQQLRYGERVTPLHPDISQQVAAPGTVALHDFTLSNDGNDALEFQLSVMGGAWQSVLSSQSMLTLPAGASSQVRVAVTVPGLQSLGGASRDRGFIQLRTAPNGPLQSVAFDTCIEAHALPRRTVRWEYWNGRAWLALAAVDGTERLTRPGLVEFLGPADMALATRFGVSGYWVRTVLEPGDAQLLPRVCALAPNTTLASQTVTVRNELLGSSDASENQQFKTTRVPVLSEQLLEVRERGPLPDDEVAALTALYGSGALSAASNGRSNEFWVRWTAVVDLYGSGPLDRHYVLDRFTGQIRFGDGLRGRIPARGVGNIRMARYQTGGGSGGNRPAGSIVQLKNTVPYIENVANLEAASSGFGGESTEALVARAPRTLRHGGRAVANDDYADLAALASVEIARTRCVPLRRLQQDPLGNTVVPGAVSVIIVPASLDPKPLPSLELLRRTAEFLSACQPTAVDLQVVGPLYVRVDVELEVALISLETATEVEQAIRQQLAAFLHPLTGGRGGTGWDFGREPHRSDLHAVVSTVAGVDHIRRLALVVDESFDAVRASGRFLVYSGEHRIELTFVGAQ